MKVELIHIPGCPKCAASRDDLKTAATEAVADLDWREVNALDEMDRAVDLGVLNLPALAINGEVVFSSLPTGRQLREELLRRIAKG